MSDIEYRYLSRVNTPADLRSMSLAELKSYAEELRRYIVECCAANPGHLGSSLGTVELTIALHYA